MQTVRRLNRIAAARSQMLAQTALAWVLRHRHVTSVPIGASASAQVKDAADTLRHASLSGEELAAIDAALAG